MFFAPKLYKGTARGEKHGKRTKVDINMKAGRFARNPPAFYLFVFRNEKNRFLNFFVRVLGDFIDSLKRRHRRRFYFGFILIFGAVPNILRQHSF